MLLANRRPSGSYGINALSAAAQVSSSPGRVWVQADSVRSTSDVHSPNGQVRKTSTASRVFRLLPVLSTLGISILITFAMVYFSGSLGRLGGWGYLGVFLIQLANSASIILPAPGQVATFGMAITLNPFLLGLIGGVGAGLGEVTGYIIGTRGHEVLKESHLYGHLETFAKRWSGPALFGCALLPIPFDIAGVWAGTVRYPLHLFLIHVTAGKVLKITGIAMAGAFGVPWLLD